MGTNLNFNNFGNEQPAEVDWGGRPPGNFGLVRQSSIYSLTFDEFQNTMGGIGKDFGSMNMDELLKNIWSAEETQIMGSAGGRQDGGVPGGYLQRQGSLTLPRTLSQKTVDEVWRGISKEYGGVKDGIDVGVSNLPQRQQTLGEITLEEFLVKAGVVREDAQLMGKPNAVGFLGDLSRPCNNTALGIGFQQTVQSTGLMGNRVPESNNQTAIQSSNQPLNVNGFRPTQQELLVPPVEPHQKQSQLFPKQATLSYTNLMATPSRAQLGSTDARGTTIGITDPSIDSNLVQSATVQGGGIGMVGLGPGRVTVKTGSPVSSDGVGKSNGDISSVSPVPYVFNGSLRGRKFSTTLDKVVERRQRRMIKNRESAARSRARKQVNI